MWSIVWSVEPPGLAFTSDMGVGYDVGASVGVGALLVTAPACNFMGALYVFDEPVEDVDREVGAWVSVDVSMRSAVE